MTFDILIKGGTVIDGTGSEPAPADIGIANGRIAALAPYLSGAAKTTIPAAGRTVAPGFIDITNHADTNASLFTNPHQDLLLAAGVTTILTGNCGTSAAPIISGAAVDALRKWRGDEGPTVNWSSLAEYHAILGHGELGPNVGTLVGHGTIRRGITNGEARRLTKDEVAQVAHHMEAAIAEGAFGVSFGLAYAHEFPTDEGELTQLLTAVARAGGVAKFHIRSEGVRLVAAVNEVVQGARESGARAIISHLKAIGKRAWPLFPRAIEIIDRARAVKTPITFDTSPYERTGSFLYLVLPPWVRDGGFVPMLERMKRPADRARIEGELSAETLHFDRMMVASGRAIGASGRTIEELARRAGRSPIETLLDLLIATEGRATIFGKTLRHEDVAAAIRHPASIVASDGTGIPKDATMSGDLIHPRSTGAFPHFLHRFVLDRKVLAWPDAIRKITSAAAAAVGIQDRGTIAEGQAADIVIFDPDTLRDRSTYHAPYATPIGIDQVIVNGTIAVRDGALTGAYGGRILKNGDTR